MLNEIVGDIYQLDFGSITAWVNEFTGYYDGVMDENDGCLDNPNFFKTEIRKDLTFKIEFHPGDTLYFINDINIGSTGPHWMLYCFKWCELLKLINGSNNEELLFWLLLPMVGITPNDEINEINKVILDKIRVFPKLFSSEHVHDFIDTIIAGVMFQEGFLEVETVGTVCKNQNSFRYIRKDNKLEISSFNKQIAGRIS